MLIQTSSLSFAWGSLAVSIAMGSFAQITLKHTTNLLSVVKQRYRAIPWLLLWGLLFAGAMVFWIFALRRLDISIAYPLMSLGYVVVTGLAAILLREHVTKWRWIAVGLITCGAAMVAGSV
ncbi:EamA family transporter [Terriglobus sp. TAA 43]|uniref:EamA family transporter n=1 Tax=Terriglobus sp. TAA 43 TaxID=278961 RepID=UPI00068A6F9A|nr:EamA family transporter [Terriglobus sp. TAA 43]